MYVVNLCNFLYQLHKCIPRSMPQLHMLGILRFRPLVPYLTVITAYEVRQVLPNDMTLVKLQRKEASPVTLVK